MAAGRATGDGQGRAGGTAVGDRAARRRRPRPAAASIRRAARRRRLAVVGRPVRGRPAVTAGLFDLLARTQHLVGHRGGWLRLVGLGPPVLAALDGRQTYPRCCWCTDPRDGPTMASAEPSAPKRVRRSAIPVRPTSVIRDVVEFRRCGLACRRVGDLNINAALHRPSRRTEVRARRGCLAPHLSGHNGLRATDRSTRPTHLAVWAQHGPDPFSIIAPSLSPSAVIQLATYTARHTRPSTSDQHSPPSNRHRREPDHPPR